MNIKQVGLYKVSYSLTSNTPYRYVVTSKDTFSKAEEIAKEYGEIISIEWISDDVLMDNDEIDDIDDDLVL